MAKPWIKSWVVSLKKAKVMGLPPDLFKCWQILQWIAGENDKGGLLPSVSDCALAMHESPAHIEEMFYELLNRGLLELDAVGWSLHDWDVWQPAREKYPSDAAAATAARKRAQRERERAVTSRDNVDVTSMSRVVTSRDEGVTSMSRAVTTRDTQRASAPARVGSQPNALRLDSLQGEEKKTKETASLSLSPSTHAGVQAQAHASMVSALMVACGSPDGATPTKGEMTRYMEAASEILNAGGTIEQVPIHAQNYRAMFDATLTPRALKNHWSETANAPRYARGVSRPVTYNEQKNKNTMDAVKGFRAMMGEGDESATLRAADDANGDRVRRRSVGPAVEGVLGSSRKDKR